MRRDRIGKGDPEKLNEALKAMLDEAVKDATPEKKASVEKSKQEMDKMVEAWRRGKQKRAEQALAEKEKTEEDKKAEDLT